MQVSGILVLVLALALLNGWMYLQQPHMIFLPYRQLDQTPADWGLAYEDVSLGAAQGPRLHGWYIPHPGSRRVLLFFHGNAGNISHRGESVAIFHRLGLNVFIFDYRGYGQSAGKPGEAGLYEDAAAAWHYLTHDRGFAREDIVLFGRSLGGAVASRLAADVQPRALILESTFSSAHDMAQSVFPVLSRLIVLRFRFNTAAYINRVTCPLLVVHSPDDEIIPFRVGERVYQAARPPKVLIRIRGDHNTGFIASQPAYEHALAEFLRIHVPGDEPARD
jgi:fermentation-respiration switch protein FrsA (DUF1100 family)